MEDARSKTMLMKQVSTGSNLKGVDVTPSQIGWGMKRHRTAGVNSEMDGGLDDAEERVSTGNQNKAETTTGGPPPKAWSSDLEKSGVGLLGHRFVDATVIVPIKKRKIHVEVLRSPSPPPRSPSPCVETVNVNENGNASEILHPPEDPELMDGECPQVKGDGETTSSSRDFLLAEEEKVCNILAELKEVHDVATSLDLSKATAQITENVRQDGVDRPDNDHDQAEVELSNEGKLEGSEVESLENDETNSTNEKSLHDCLENDSYTNNRSEYEVAMDCIAEEGGSTKCGGWIEWDNDELEETEEHVDYGEEDILEYDEIIEGANMHPRQELGDSDVDITPDSFDVLEETENSIEGKESDAVIEAADGLEEDLLDKQSGGQENRSLEHGSGTKPSGWDQLPKGFDSVEDALRAAKEKSERHISRGPPRGTAIRRASVGGRLSWGMTSPAMARESHGSRRMEEDASTRFASRDFGPVRQLGRGGGGSTGLLLPGRARFDYCNEGLGNSSSHWGPNRQQHSPSRYGGHVGFGSRGERENFVPGIDRMSIARRGGLRSVIGSSHGGGRGMTMKGPSTGIEFSGRIGVGPNKGMDARRMMRGIGYGSSDSYRGRSFRGSGMDSALHRTYLGDQRLGLLRRERSLSPRRNRDSPSQHSKPYTSRNSVGIGSISGMQIERGRTQVAPSPKLMSVLSSRSQRSPPKWSTERREGGYIQSDWDFKRSSARRTSPHVVHGSSLTDERDRQVLAGAWNGSPKHKQIEPTCGRSGSVGKPTDGNLETRRGKQEEDDSFREAGISRSSSRDRGRVVSGSLRRERGRDDDERWREKPGRESRRANGPKQGGGGTWDGDDDVAPRRRRPP